MSERTSYAHGTPSWVDIMSADIETTRSFYTAVFGWELGPEEAPEAGGYRQFLKNGKRVAASSPQSPEMIDAGMPTVWNTYMTVDSATEVAALVEKAGGTVIAPPFDVFDAGSMAMFADTEGAMFSVWQPNQHIGAELVNEPGSVCWNELASRTPGAASAFYGDVLGWHTQVHQGEMVYREFQLTPGEPGVGGMVEMTEEWGEMPAHWMVYFAVEDCDAAVAKVEELGGKVMVPALDIPPGRFSVVADPTGAAFTVMALAELPE